jgi:hypothetical protein
MITSEIDKIYRKFKESENILKSLEKEIYEPPIWPKAKSLIEKYSDIHFLYYKLAGDLSYLLKTQK